MKSTLATALLTCAPLFALANPPSTASQCKGCTLKEELIWAQKQPNEVHDKVMFKGSDAIKKTRPNMEGKWDAKQIRGIIELLQAEKDREFRQFMMEDSFIRFKDNRNEIRKQLGDLVKEKKMTVQESEDILADIDAVTKSADEGNNPPVPRGTAR